MKKSKFHTIEIKQREGTGQVLTGGNTQVFIDRKALRGCTRLTLDVQAAGVAKVTFEMVAKVKFSARTKKLKKSKIQPSGFKPFHDSKQYGLYTLSNYYAIDGVGKVGKKK